MPRKLKNANITHVSYVDKGANKKKFFLMKSDTEPDFQKDVKVLINKNDEERLVYGVVYEPDVADAHDDMMEAKEIEKAAHTFLKEYRQIDKQHDFQEGYGDVVESYVAPQDFTVGDETIAKGSWVLVTKADEDTWEAIKKGEITGYSMAGTAEVEEVQEPAPETQMQKFFGVMKEFFSKGELTDAYNKTRTRRNLFDALYMFEDFVANEAYSDNPDPNKLREYATEVGDILYSVATSPDIVKAIHKELDERDEVSVKKEELQELLKAELEPITAKLEALEKEEKKDPQEEPQPKEPQGPEPDELKKALAEVVKEAVQPLNERLDAVEKARGISKSAEQDHEGEEDVEKNEDESVFKSLFTYKGQL